MRLQRFIDRAVASGGLGMLAALVLYGAAAQAITISPVLVELSPARRVVSITISNPGERAISFQTETLSWSQQDGTDRYAETSDLIVVPPIADIAAGGSQIFRVTLNKPSGAREQAYRLIFEDVTAQAPASSDEVAVNIRINHNLPVFVAAAGKPRAQPRLGPCAEPTPAKTGCVRIDNDGERYLQVRSLTLESGTWRKQISVSARVLAGAWRQWTFDLPDGLTGAVQVHVDTAERPLNIDLPIATR